MSLRECIDGPLKGAVFNLPEGRASAFFHRREGTGRYLPVGDKFLKFEYWRKMSDKEIKEMQNVTDNTV